MAFNAGAVIGYLTLEKGLFTKGLKDADRETETFAQKFAKNSEKIGSNINNFGKSMTKVGLGLSGIFATTIKFASDNIEVTGKFNRAFKGVEEQAKQTALVLQKSYGLSGLESKKLLSNTADLLKGFGATSKEALDMSATVQKMSVDLASYNNVQGGATRASRILTKAMLGNKDGLEELGAKVLDSDVALRLLKKGQQDLTGQALKFAKATATLELVMEQNKDATGDWSRTSGEAANSLRAMKSDAINMAVEIGTNLIPITKDLISSFSGIIKSVTGWMRENPGLSSTLVKVTAAIGGLLLVGGPLVALTGKLIIIMPKLGAAFVAFKKTLMLANPVFLAISAAVTAIGIAATVASKAFLKASEERLKKVIEIGNKEGKINREVSQYMAQASDEERAIINERIKRLTKMGVSNTEIFRNIHIGLSNNSKDFKAWKEKVLQSMNKVDEGSDGTGDAVKEMSDRIKGILETSSVRYKELVLDQFAFSRFQAKKTYDENFAILKQGGADEAAFLNLKRTYNLELVQIEKERNAKIKAERDKNLAEQQEEFSVWQTMEEEKVEMEDERDMIAMEKRTAIQDIVKNMAMERQMLFANERQIQQSHLLSWYQKELATLEANATDHETFLKLKADLDNTYYLKKDKLDMEFDAKQKMRWQQWVGFAAQSLGQLSGLIQQHTDQKIQTLETEYEKEKQFIIDNVEDEDERNKQLQALEDELTAKKRAAAKGAFLANKASSMAGAVINTANAVTGALKAPFPFNLVLAGIVGAMGAAQIGLIASQKMPAMAEGGMVTGPTTALIGEGGQNEVVYPLDRFERLLGIDEDGENSRGGNILNFYIDTLDGPGLVDSIHNKVLPILQDAFNSEILLVNPRAVRGS